MVYPQTVTSTHGGEGAKGQKLFLSPSQLLSLSQKEELEETVKVVISTHTEASDEVRLLRQEPVVVSWLPSIPFPFLVTAPYFPCGK